MLGVNQKDFVTQAEAARHDAQTVSTIVVHSKPHTGLTIL
jgi:hypothetical protein